MENVKEATVDVLTDILKLHNDRIQGYEMAIDDTEDADLKALFSHYADQSRQLSNDLTASIERAGGTPPEGTTFLGQLHKGWMELKAAITSRDRAAVLASCEQGEDAIKAAYEKAIEPDSVVLMSVRTTLHQQYDDIKNAHDRIKALRDSAKA